MIQFIVKYCRRLGKSGGIVVAKESNPANRLVSDLLMARNRSGETALHVAARSGSLESVDFLLKEHVQMMENSKTKNMIANESVSFEAMVLADLTDARFLSPLASAVTALMQLRPGDEELKTLLGIAKNEIEFQGQRLSESLVEKLSGESRPTGAKVSFKFNDEQKKKLAKVDDVLDDNSTNFDTNDDDLAEAQQNNEQNLIQVIDFLMRKSGKMFDDVNEDGRRSSPSSSSVAKSATSQVASEGMD